MCGTSKNHSTEGDFPIHAFSLGVEGEALRLYSFFFTRIDFINILRLKSANFKNIIKINLRLGFSTRYN